MYPQLFRGVVFPALNHLNGTRIHQVLRQLEGTESHSLDQLRALQDEKLDRMLGWVRQHSSFYPDFWRTAPDTQRVGSLYPQLDGLPVVGKPELRDAVDGGLFPEPAFEGRSIRVNTSGSTGRPMVFFRSAEQESWFWALRLRMWGWAGYRPGEPYMAINLNQRTAWKKRLQDILFRCTYLTYNADTQDSAHIVDLLAQRGIQHINAFSSTLVVLARHMEHHGIPNPGVRALTATGDNLDPEQRALVSRAFGGVPVTDYYGAGGEGVHLASQCEANDRYHVHMENAITEILDLRKGRPAEPGEVGTIVITQLDNHAMPLIRYNLGDLATVGDDTPCSCGRQFPTIADIHGRACDMIYTPSGGALLPQFFFIAAFKFLENVYRYQIVQDRIDHLTIKLVAEEGCDRGACERSLEANINAAAGHVFTMDFEWVDEIPLTDYGKPRPVISKLDGPPRPNGTGAG